MSTLVPLCTLMNPFYFCFMHRKCVAFLPMFTVLSAFASLLFNLPAVLTHAAPVPWISQDCLVRLHILSALPCLVSAISTSSLLSLWFSLSLHPFWFSLHYPLYWALLPLLLSIAVACSMTNVVDDVQNLYCLHMMQIVRFILTWVFQW